MRLRRVPELAHPHGRAGDEADPRHPRKRRALHRASHDRRGQLAPRKGRWPRRRRDHTCPIRWAVDRCESLRVRVADGVGQRTHGAVLQGRGPIRPARLPPSAPLQRRRDLWERWWPLAQVEYETRLLSVAEGARSRTAPASEPILSLPTPSTRRRPLITSAAAGPPTRYHPRPDGYLCPRGHRLVGEHGLPEIPGRVREEGT